VLCYTAVSSGVIEMLIAEVLQGTKRCSEATAKHGD